MVDELPLHTSWTELEGPPPVEENNRHDIAAVFAMLFSSLDGQMALEYLRKQTIERPTLAQGLPDGLNTVIYQNIREGENNLYRLIVSLIAKGQELS